MIVTKKWLSSVMNCNLHFYLIQIAKIETTSEIISSWFMPLKNVLISLNGNYFICNIRKTRRAAKTLKIRSIAAKTKGQNKGCAKFLPRLTLGCILIIYR